MEHFIDWIVRFTATVAAAVVIEQINRCFFKKK